MISCASGPACNGGPSQSPNNIFSLTGDTTGTQVSTSSISILDALTNGVAGFFNVTMTGSWNLPQFSTGGVTQVPEPGMMGLFGGGVLVMVARRRRKRHPTA